MNTNRFALVTGASSGIGKAIALELAGRKINVLLVALPYTGLMEVVSDIRNQFNVCADGLEIDLTTVDAARSVYQWCRLNNYRVNILVNNAGFGNLCSLENSDPTLITNMMLLNNQALVLLTQAFIPALKRNAPSYILNLGSLASFMPIPNKSVYAATKSFVYSFSSSLRLELSASGVAVSCLCPGGTATSTHVRSMMKEMQTNMAFVQLPEQVAYRAIRGLFKKEFRIIPGWHNQVFYGMQQLLPEFAVSWLVLRIFNRKPPERQTVAVTRTPAHAFALVFR
jgi:uncharacterized protein